jgi:hypothetical protein
MQLGALSEIFGYVIYGIGLYGTYYVLLLSIMRYLIIAVVYLK